MHDPVAPVFRATLADQQLRDTGGAVARLREIAHGCAGLIDPDFPGVRAVEIDLGHVGLLREPCSRALRICAAKIAAAESAEYPDRFLTGELRGHVPIR